MLVLGRYQLCMRIMLCLLTCLFINLFVLMTIVGLRFIRSMRLRLRLFVLSVLSLAVSCLRRRRLFLMALGLLLLMGNFFI